jgi:translation initiation factor IF-2
MSYDILVEEFGGDVQCVQVSAKQGLGITELLEKIQLQAEVMNLKAPVACRAEGTVLESRVDRGLGVVVTALVAKGNLKIGDFVLAGPSWGKVRRLISDQGKDIKEAGPSTPVQVTLLSSFPMDRLFMKIHNFFAIDCGYVGGSRSR